MNEMRSVYCAVQTGACASSVKGLRQCSCSDYTASYDRVTE